MEIQSILWVVHDDSDGYSNDVDKFPNDWKWNDTDNDGFGDNSDKFPNDQNEWNDADGDGVGDNSDAFPNDANETQDSDGDGIGDNGDEFPFIDNFIDSDYDEIIDKRTDFPEDPTQWNSDGMVMEIILGGTILIHSSTIPTQWSLTVQVW